MGKKITICALFVSLFSCSIKQQTNEYNTDSSYDTVYFEKPYFFADTCKLLRGKGHLLFEGTGKSLWVDSVLYSSCSGNRIILLARTPDKSSYQLIHFDGDSLKMDIVSRNPPVMTMYELRTFLVVSVSDNIYNSGQLTSVTSLYKISQSAELLGELRFYQDIDAETGNPESIELQVEKVSPDSLQISEINLKSSQRNVRYLTGSKK
jgi:hypothetical protein